MTESQVIAEIKNTYKSYDAEGLIDEITLSNLLKSELKRFGNNIMVYSDDIVKVKGGKGELPKDFWALQYAERYRASHYECDDKSRDILQDSHYWKMTVERDEKFVDGKAVRVETKKTVTEDIYFRDATAKLYYSNPTPLYLTKGYNRKSVTKDCINLPKRLINGKYNEINILGNYIQTNFRDGYIYIKYKALPTDENGEIYIPETQHDRLKEYILYYLKWKTLEGFYLNDDDPNLINKIQYLAQMTADSLSLAMTETKMSTLTKRTWKDIKKINQREIRMVTAMFPNM